MDATVVPPDGQRPDDSAALRDLVRRLQAEQERLRASQADLLAEAFRLRQENAKLQAEQTRLGQENAQLQAEQAQHKQQIAELLTELARLRQDNAELRGKVDAAARQRFGRSSERRPRTTLGQDKTKRKRHRHGRSRLPANLERRTEIHDLTDAEKPCPCCGKMRECIGTQESEQLDMQPAQFFVRHIVKKTYACADCSKSSLPSDQRFQTASAGPVGPLPGSRCGPGLLAHIIVAKYADHTPLHRLVGQLERSGVRLCDSTLGDWVAQAARLLEPLVELMRKRVLLCRVIHTDDTPVLVRLVGAKGTIQGHLWVYIGDLDHRYVVFDFTENYKKDGPHDFLKGYTGYVQADALAQYEGLYGADKAKHCCCWAHARRGFIETVASGDERGNAALDLIGQLYGIEDNLPELIMPLADGQDQPARLLREQERQKLREAHSKAVLAELKKWLDEQRPVALPKSPLGKAIGYCLNNWEALERYVEQGYLAIDNNLSERTLRVVGLGRNNWVALGSKAGGKTAAVLYTVVQTCRYQGIDPYAYLKEALVGLYQLGEKPTEQQLQEWLPERWKQRSQKSGPPVGVATGPVPVATG
jgi:transposase